MDRVGFGDKLLGNKEWEGNVNMGIIKRILQYRNSNCNFPLIRTPYISSSYLIFPIKHPIQLQY